MDDISAECDWLAGLVSSCLLWFSLGRGWDVEQLSGGGGHGEGLEGVGNTLGARGCSSLVPRG